MSGDFPSKFELSITAFPGESVPGVDGRSEEYDLTLRASHAFDLSRRFSLDTGVGAGAVYFVQHFETNAWRPRGTVQQARPRPSWR